MLLDQLSRPLRDLRISVTDRCNMRCTYCMPSEFFGPNHAFLERDELLTYEEIDLLTRIFVQLGVVKVRVTGGEPLLRRELPELISRLAKLPEISDLTLTTNGLLLARYAASLKKAGLHRVTVSLDSLDQEQFDQLNGVGVDLAEVLEGIEEALHVGLSPLKINAVIQRGVNESAILDLVERFHGTNCIVRFIEYMDVGNTNGWKSEDVVGASEIIQEISRHHSLSPVEPNYKGEVARRWRFDDGGEIGVIASVTQPFCGDCTRARLSPEGRLYSCLFASEGFNLRSMLRGGASVDAIRQSIETVWAGREDRYSEERSKRPVSGERVEMSHIGG
jgi:cyclic pyranopterin phosphate synthase